MPASENNSVVKSRLAELKAELTGVNMTVRQIDEALATLRGQAEADPEFAQNIDFIGRMTVDGGRKRIVVRRKSEIEAEIDRLESLKRD